MAMDREFPDAVVQTADTRIVFVVMDGVGGLPDPATGLTELETARTPNLDRVAGRAAVGLQRPVGVGVTPGSGPGHLALFGYDPRRWMIGRGVLSALGVGFDLRPGDLAARLNLATLDDTGSVVDRRAGRPPDEEGRRVVRLLRERVGTPDGLELFWEAEKEHRAVMILRGEGLSDELEDTDPQRTGAQPLRPRATAPAAERTAALVDRVLADARAALRAESPANGLLARGFALYERYPSMTERYGLRCLATARYPMYQGVARLLGMEVAATPETDAAAVATVTSRYSEFDFHFLHFKHTDSRGEDGDFAAKVAAIEAIDALLPDLEDLDPDVIVVTGDHSTPAVMASHSWHPVPLLIASQWCRGGTSGFGERACLAGEIGTIAGRNIMALALAHARRLRKFGA
ncbi:MAG: 2,3-bisphosphoglycerate-independent phosphoglycerate mutase [Gemmatimonadota bacterium]